MTLRKTSLMAAIMFATLAACSNGKFQYGKAFGDLSDITGVKTGLEEAATEANIEATKTAPEGAPLIVGFKAIRVALPYAGDSGTSQTYDSPDGVKIAMNSGFVTRATGLGIDMNGTYLPADSPWLNGIAQASDAGETTTRIVEYWKEGRLKRDQFSCSLETLPREGAGSIVEESCKRFFEPTAFTNRYWIAADNTVECSRQWIHPQLEPLQFFSTEQQALTLDLTKNGC